MKCVLSGLRGLAISSLESVERTQAVRGVESGAQTQALPFQTVWAGGQTSHPCFLS